MLGFYINLPKPHPTYVALPAPYKDQTLIKFKNYLYFEEKDESEKIEKELKPLPGSQVLVIVTKRVNTTRQNGDSMTSF